MSQQQPNGLPCPQCASLIQLTAEALLVPNCVIHCSACGLRLEVDPEESRDAISALRTLKRGTRDAEVIQREYGN